MRMEEIVEDVRDIHYDRCRDEGRVPEREHTLWSREPSIDKDDNRKPTEEVRRDAEHLRREERAAAGVQFFEDSRLTKLINEGGSTVLCCQLWAEGGGAVWKQVKVPENGDMGMLKRRMRSMSRSRAEAHEEQEQG